MALPQDLLDAAEALDYGETDRLDVAGGTGGASMGHVELYVASGCVSEHVDDVGEGMATLGLVVVNDADFHLRTEDGIFPMPVGSIYRIDPLRPHSTCMADGSWSADGRLAFVACDMDPEDGPEDTPAQFAQWILDSLRQRLADCGAMREPGVGP